jgi:hypothetical protein
MLRSRTAWRFIVPNPGKPAELKRQLGSRHYDPAPSVEVEPVKEIPEPSRRLEESGLMLWSRVWSMAQSWVSPNTDVELLQMTCEMLDERDHLRVYVADNPEAWHERKALRELDKAIVSNLSLLGFTPTDRARLGVAEVKMKSKVAELREMRDKIRGV